MPKNTQYITEIKQILREARTKAYAAINYSMVEAYWLIGKRIVEEIQQGGHRANYGEQVIKNISKAITADFGRGFSDRSIRQYRQFYQRQKSTKATSFLDDFGLIKPISILGKIFLKDTGLIWGRKPYTDWIKNWRAING